MKDIYPMWKMCFVFRFREMSRNADHIRHELELKGLRGEELEDQVTVELAEGKKYGIPKRDAIGSYVFHYYPELRDESHRDTVSPRKTREKNPSALREAVDALNNCIKVGFISEKDDRVYLETGRMLVSNPCWRNPLSRNKEEKWNLNLVNEYIVAFGQLRAVIASIVGTTIALNPKVTLDFIESHPTLFIFSSDNFHGVYVEKSR